MPSRLETDSAVEQVAAGTYRATIDRGWWIHQGPNGGYIAALLTRAIGAEIDDPARIVRSCTVHFLRPPAEGPVEATVAVRRVGRSLSTVQAELSQDGRLLAIAVAAVATGRSGPLEFDQLAAPSVPAPEDLDPPAPSPDAPPKVPMADRYDLRHCIGTPPMVVGPEALSGGWIRQIDGGVVDLPALIAYTDAWPPAVFSLGTFVPVPTVDLTVHVRRDPRAHDTAWCLMRFRTRVAVEGFLDVDGEVWSRDGVLLARSRQLAVMLDPPPD